MHFLAIYIHHKHNFHFSQGVSPVGHVLTQFSPTFLYLGQQMQSVETKLGTEFAGQFS
jgi:hypothetical protein